MEGRGATIKVIATVSVVSFGRGKPLKQSLAAGSGAEKTSHSKSCIVPGQETRMHPIVFCAGPRCRAWNAISARGALAVVCASGGSKGVELHFESDFGSGP